MQQLILDFDFAKTNKAWLYKGKLAQSGLCQSGLEKASGSIPTRGLKKGQHW